MNLNDFRLDLDLLQYSQSLLLSEKKGVKYVFDPIRKKSIMLQPEEMVRQLLIIWFIERTKISRNMIQVEKLVTINTLRKRFDLLIYDKNTQPLILIECKAPSATIDQSVFDQISSYNHAMKAPYLFITNGHSSWMTENDPSEKKYKFFSDLPDWLIRK